MVQNPLRIVMLGPPGAGKGTQAVLLAKSRAIPHISTGEILREAIANDSPLGREVKAVLDAGNLVSDKLMIDLIRQRLSKGDSDAGFVLDGFPRTLAQAQALSSLLGEMGKPLTNIVELNVSDSVLLERIRLRGAKGSGRSDDNVEVAARRLKVYWEQTAPVSAYYEERKELSKVDGLGTIEEVQNRISAGLGGVVKSLKK